MGLQRGNLFNSLELGREVKGKDLFLLFKKTHSEFTGIPSDEIITPIPVWGPGYEISFEFYLNSDPGVGYQWLFGVVGSTDTNADLIGYGQPGIFYINGRLAIWFAINGDKEGRPYYGAGDHLGLWYFPYGGTVEIGVNKWHHLTVSSVKEDGIV